MNKRVMDICRQIRLHRQAKGLSLQEFADKLHKSKATVSKYENGQISIDMETLLEITDILQIPMNYIMAPRGEAGSDVNKGFHSRQYLYSYARGKLGRSVIEHYYTEDPEKLSVSFFYDVPSFDDLAKCKGIYYGTMSKHGTVLNYQLINQKNPTEHTFLCCLESLDNSNVNMGLLSSISFNDMSPNAIKVLLSPVRLPENQELKDLLLFDKEDIKRMRKDNMLTIIRK